MKRRYGHLRSAPRTDDREVMGLVRALPVRASRPTSVSYRGLVASEVRDQGQTSACEGMGWAMALFLRARLSGGAGIPFPSPMAIYGLAREIDQGPDAVTLADAGTYSRSVVTALKATGIVGDHLYPFLPAQIGERPPWDVVQLGSDARVGDDYWINTTGEQRCDELRSALWRGFPITFGMQVDAAFEDGTFDIYNGTTGPILGGHCMCIVGYDATSFLVVNSWSPGWGDEGFARISDNAIGSKLCDSFGMVEIAPAAIDDTPNAARAA